MIGLAQHNQDTELRDNWITMARDLGVAVDQRRMQPVPLSPAPSTSGRQRKNSNSASTHSGTRTTAITAHRQSPQRYGPAREAPDGHPSAATATGTASGHDITAAASHVVMSGSGAGARSMAHTRRPERAVAGGSGSHGQGGGVRIALAEHTPYTLARRLVQSVAASGAYYRPRCRCHVQWFTYLAHTYPYKQQLRSLFVSERPSVLCP